MGLFDNYNETEKGLLETYSQMFTVMGIPEAQKIARDMLNQAIEESKKEGTYNLPSNLGDIFLQGEKTDENTRLKFEKKRKEGVRDDDIRWWYNLNDVERKMLCKTDDLFKLVGYKEQRKRGLSEQEAAEQIRKYHPIFGNPDNTTFAREEDRPLPLELKDRINIYIEKRAKENSEKVKKEIESFSTFNALIRKEIKAGNI